MKDWLRQNRTFAAVAAGGVVLLLVVWAFGVRGPLARAGDLRRRAEERVRRLEELHAAGVPSDEILARGAARVQQERAAYRALVEAVRLRIPPAHAPREGEDAVQRFHRVLAQEEERFRGRIVWVGRQGVRFGFEEPHDEKEAAQWLDRVAVVAGLLGALEAAGIEKIEALDPYDGMEMRRWGGPEDEEARDGLRAVRVRVQFRAPAERLMRVLHALQDPRTGRYLAVAALEARQAGTGRDEMEVTLTAAGLVVPEEP